MKFHTWTCAHCGEHLVSLNRVSLNAEAMSHVFAFHSDVASTEESNADVG